MNVREAMQLLQGGASDEKTQGGRSAHASCAHLTALMLLELPKGH
jgi:hypothetical protein